MNLGMTLRGLTGAIDPDQNGINGRMGGPLPAQQGMPPMGGAGGPTVMPEGKPSFFAQGGMGRTLAGLIGDTLLQQADMAPVYSPMMQQRRQAEQAEAQWSRRQDATRTANREDQQWEWQNRPATPQAPTEFERALEGSGVQRGTPQWTQAMGQRATNILNPDPPITMTLPNGQMYVGPRSGLPAAVGGGAATPPRPVGNLTPITGGPTPQASATFRP